ncbi:AN1-type zinc finger domain-containing protein [Candidatus Nitrosotenuis sp. DW1]|uniref:AN1-type zinc finger domain-containing protein n=1 Tax=Candidatus Nitrosotenuis sp. DW1 TaxID=2259672 RepID=UPI0015C92519|nr:AN1-type zinc finger domain-containing protein [Candidatus Nitrosotenuis sp. DW1]QLH09825.1 nucleotide-binding protein [Candidatus Nitrosotenuis sp. DW1]
MKKVDCAYCGNETELPFECNYCKDSFCSEHRLPEEHRCVKLSQIRAKRFGQKSIIREQKGGIFKKIFHRRKN